MGIPAIVVVAMKHVTFDKVATFAMQYGPDIFRKLKERLQTRPQQEGAGLSTVAELSERLREISEVLLKQEEIIEQQNGAIELLKENCKTLQARLAISLILAAAASVLTLALLVVLLFK
jgi:hypothetical protein